MTISRRGFLQVAGITLAASQLGAFTPLAALAEDAPLKGRVLEPVSLGGQALWPDSVVRILEADGERYRLAEGWVPRSAVQPMFLDTRPTPMRAMPDYVEVSAPVAPIYQSASTTAPLLARIGHGGVLAVQDSLRDSTGEIEWVGVQHKHKTGWVQAARVAAVEQAARFTFIMPPTDTRVVRLVVNRAQQTLTVSSGGQMVLTTPISTTTTKPLWSGQWGFWSTVPSQPATDNEAYVKSWWLRANNGFELTGVYWHNAFGSPQPGPDIQLPMPVARWLYEASAADTVLVVE